MTGSRSTDATAAAQVSTCRTCGFEWGDVHAAIQSIHGSPAWYRSILGGADDAVGRRFVQLRRPSRPWTAVEIVRHVVDGMARTVSTLEDVIAGRRPRSGVKIGAPQVIRRKDSIADVVVALEAATNRLTLLAWRLDDQDWQLETISIGRVIVVGDVVRRSAHEAYHHGVELESILDGRS